MLAVGIVRGHDRVPEGRVGRGGLVEHLARGVEMAGGGVHCDEGSADAEVGGEPGTDGPCMELQAEFGVGEGGAGFEEACEGELVRFVVGVRELVEEARVSGEVGLVGVGVLERGGDG